MAAIVFWDTNRPVIVIVYCDNSNAMALIVL